MNPTRSEQVHRGSKSGNSTGTTLLEERETVIGPEQFWWNTDRILIHSLVQLSVVVDALRTYTDYDSFAREWHSDTLSARDVNLEVARERGLLNEQDTRRLWQLLGLVGEEKVFIQLPEWLVEEKTDDLQGRLATTFVGRISRETDDAILFEDSSPGRRLMQIAHKIHSLEHGVENTAVDSDRRARLTDKLQKEHRRFENADDIPYLSDEWLPKSQLITVIRRRA